MQITFKAKPHPAQKAIHSSGARFRVCACGRRFGKSRLAALECIEVAAAGGRAWWLAPTYKMTNVGWRPMIRIAKTIPGAVISLSEKSISFPGGGEVAIRSADNPNSLRGEGLDFVILDEAAFIDPDVWPEAIRPALSDRQGRALFISTPRGRNWFWDLFRKDGEPGWQSFSYPTSSNPFIPASEIEAAKADLPELVFRQEYLAEFVDLSGSVFRRIQEAATVEPIDKAEPGRQYAAGVDVAAAVDYTVITILDIESKRMVFMDRFNRVDYGTLEDRLAAVNERFHLSSMTVETNSIGAPVIDALSERGMPIIPFTTTSATKQTIITKLQSAFEHGEIAIINNPVLIGELLSYESSRSPSGSFTYSAPAGMHDDTVMSLAMAWQSVDGSNWWAS